MSGVLLCYWLLCLQLLFTLLNRHSGFFRSVTSSLVDAVPGERGPRRCKLTVTISGGSHIFVGSRKLQTLALQGSTC